MGDNVWDEARNGGHCSAGGIDGAQVNGAMERRGEVVGMKGGGKRGGEGTERTRLKLNMASCGDGCIGCGLRRRVCGAATDRPGEAWIVNDVLSVAAHWP